MSIASRSAVVRKLCPLLFVQDINRSIEFYRDKIGFKMANQAETRGKVFWCWLERDGAAIMLQQAGEEDGPAEGRGSGVVFYFICDDAEAMFAELTSRGLQLKLPKVAYYGMKQLFVPEPDGYSICFESEVEPHAQKLS